MNWHGQDIKAMTDNDLKSLKAHLLSFSTQRAATQHNARTTKLKIDFSSSSNGYYNTLLTAVNNELTARKL